MDIIIGLVFIISIQNSHLYISGLALRNVSISLFSGTFTISYDVSIEIAARTRFVANTELALIVNTVTTGCISSRLICPLHA